MDQGPDTPVLRAYMLRFWKVRSLDPQRPSAWRFSLEDPHTRERMGFADLDALISFLQAETASDTQVNTT